MAFQKDRFRQTEARFGNEPGQCAYRTDDTFAEVEADGYFNAVRANLRIGTLISVSLFDNNGVPIEATSDTTEQWRMYAVSAAPVGGDVAIVRQA